jgi:translation initiation factor RLI1
MLHALRCNASATCVLHLSIVRLPLTLTWSGKSTALKILSGKLKPNLGRYEGGPNPSPEWAEILAYFRGSELQVTVTLLL